MYEWSRPLAEVDDTAADESFTPVWTEVPGGTGSGPQPAVVREWVEEVVSLVRERGLGSRADDEDGLRSRLERVASGPWTEGAQTRLLFIAGPDATLVAYDVVVWQGSSEDVLDDVLLDLIGVQPDPVAGHVDEWITVGETRVKERFHLYPLPPEDGVGDAPLVWFGGLAVVSEGTPSVLVALFTVTGDTATLMASLPAAVDFLTGPELRETLALT